MKSAMRCGNCAGEITDDSRYCAQCGAEVQAVETATDTAGDAMEAGNGGSALVVAASVAPARLSGRALTEVFAAGAELGADMGGAATTHGHSRRLNGHSVHNLLTQANLYRIRGQYTEAIDCCVAVLRAQSGNATAHSLLGDIYRDQGKPDDAIQWYRMSLDLRPNPADQAKLTALEGQRQQSMGAGRGRTGRGSVSGADPLAAATGLNTGTSNLMGLSPRRWLRGIWIVSLSFLAIVLAALIAMRTPQGRVTAGKSKNGIVAGAGFGGAPTGLPPLDVQRQLAGSAMKPPPTGFPAVNTGLTAAGPAANPLRRLPESNTNAATSAGQALPTAPVLNVRALPDQTDAATGRAPRDGSSSETRDTLQPMALTGNLRLGEVRYIGNNTAAVFVTAPQELVSDAGDDTRELLVRNVYRAARTVFAQNTAYTHVNVFVQATVPAAGGDAVLLEASVDRQTATATAPDTDPLNTLVSRLQYVKWSVPAAPATTSPPELPGTDTGVGR